MAISRKLLEDLAEKLLHEDLQVNQNARDALHSLLKEKRQLDQPHFDILKNLLQTREDKLVRKINEDTAIKRSLIPPPPASSATDHLVAIQEGKEKVDEVGKRLNTANGFIASLEKDLADERPILTAIQQTPLVKFFHKPIKFLTPRFRKPLSWITRGVIAPILIVGAPIAGLIEGGLFVNQWRMKYFTHAEANQKEDQLRDVNDAYNNDTLRLGSPADVSNSIRFYAIQGTPALPEHIASLDDIKNNVDPDVVNRPAVQQSGRSLITPIYLKNGHIAETDGYDYVQVNGNWVLMTKSDFQSTGLPEKIGRDVQTQQQPHKGFWAGIVDFAKQLVGIRTAPELTSPSVPTTTHQVQTAPAASLSASMPPAALASGAALTPAAPIDNGANLAAPTTQSAPTTPANPQSSSAIDFSNPSIYTPGGTTVLLLTESQYRQAVQSAGKTDPDRLVSELFAPNQDDNRVKLSQGTHFTPNLLQAGQLRSAAMIWDERRQNSGVAVQIKDGEYAGKYALLMGRDYNQYLYHLPDQTSDAATGTKLASAPQNGTANAIFQQASYTIPQTALAAQPWKPRAILPATTGQLTPAAQQSAGGHGNQISHAAHEVRLPILVAGITVATAAEHYAEKFVFNRGIAKGAEKGLGEMAIKASRRSLIASFAVAATVFTGSVLTGSSAHAATHDALRTTSIGAAVQDMKEGNKAGAAMEIGGGVGGTLVGAAAGAGAGALVGALGWAGGPLGFLTEGACVVVGTVGGACLGEEAVKSFTSKFFKQHGSNYDQLRTQSQLALARRPGTPTRDQSLTAHA